MSLKQATAVIAAFVTAFAATLCGVLFFFKPIADDDTSVVSFHPALGLLAYVGLCVVLFAWASKEMRSAYKGAFMVAAPQVVFAFDLAFRGERGLLTAAAGAILLIATWLLVAFVYSFFIENQHRS